MMSEIEINEMKVKLIEKLGNYGILKEFEDYWYKRAEVASRSMIRVGDTNLSNIIKGQISICYEIADEARLAREKHEASANAESSSAIPEEMLSAV